MSTPLVAAVHVDAAHGFSKQTADRIRLLAGLGVEGDAHCGATVQHLSRVRRDPAQPNLRQVHLIHGELLDELERQGHAVAPGELGENCTTRGIDLLSLPTGTVLRLGEAALVAITGLRNPCRQIERFREGLLGQLISRREDGGIERRAGVMGVVLASGVVRPGDAIEVQRPPGPATPLEVV